MKISWGNHVRLSSINTRDGYGSATDQIISSLQSLGHEVNQDDKSADVHFHFDQPQFFKSPSKDIYNIIYFPWESTALQSDSKHHNTLGQTWQEVLNSADEVWTPSPIIAEWFKDFMDITPPVFVYEHGVDPIWQPVKRTVEDKFSFFHVGADAARKGGSEAMKALRLAFPNNRDVELNMKIISKGWNIGSINRINIINESLSVPALVEMFQQNHAFVYPSYGEGFGLTPLQAMATAMPTITLPAWAPYADLLNPDLCISSKPIKSPWPRIHPGNMLKPKLDDVVVAMRHTYDNYETVVADAQARVDDVRRYYDWKDLTKNSFDSLAKRLEK